MIKFNRCLFIILSLTVLFSVDSRAIDNNTVKPSLQPPAKPLKKSDIGYITVTSDDVKLSPPDDKVFITSQAKLPFFAELKDSYIFIYPSDTGSMLCKIPKLQRYVTLFVLYTDTKIAHFRGSLEAETIPFDLRKGEEISIEKELNDSYLAEVSRNDSLFIVSVAKAEKGISFNKNSAFDLFVAEQNKKGLVFYENQWIPEKRAKTLEDAKMAAIRLEEGKMENIKMSASQGYVLLADRQMIKGKLKGSSSDSLLFDIDGKERWIPLNEISDAPYEKVIAMGLRYDAQAFYDKALARFKNKEFGETMRYIDAAERILKDKIRGKDDVSVRITADVNKLLADVNAVLDQNSKAVYNYHVFLKKDLNYHLDKRHIYFNNSVWIKPSQICSDCKGEGLVNCKQCAAKGYIQKICEHCQNGQVVCKICSGEGRRICPDCNGTGNIIKKCQTCLGRGTITLSGVQFYPSYYNPGSIVITGGGTSLVDIGGPRCYNPPVIWGPYSQQQTCPACNGSGETDRTCKRCNGAGKISCPKFTKCSFCDGKGFIKVLCSACQGKKKVKCQTCSGHGFTGEPEKSPSDLDFKSQAQPLTSGTGGPREKIVLP